MSAPNTDTPPVILCFGGFDPTNGAGLQADSLTIRALGCHPLSVLTANTVQDSREVQQFFLTEPAVLTRQAEALLADMPVAACKTGMLGSPALVEAVSELIARLVPDAPLIVDPVLAAGGGASLAAGDLAGALRRCLLSRATVVTPNIPELLALAGPAASADLAARRLLDGGCANLLVTGTHDATTREVVHRLYRSGGEQSTSQWPRLDAEYHGSGCTLAAALACYLARGMPLTAAIDSALNYTWQSLKRSYRVGRGQRFPDRTPAA